MQRNQAGWASPDRVMHPAGSPECNEQNNDTGTEAEMPDYHQVDSDVTAHACPVIMLAAHVAQNPTRRANQQHWHSWQSLVYRKVGTMLHQQGSKVSTRLYMAASTASMQVARQLRLSDAAMAVDIQLFGFQTRIPDTP